MGKRIVHCLLSNQTERLQKITKKLIHTIQTQRPLNFCQTDPKEAFTGVCFTWVIPNHHAPLFSCLCSSSSCLVGTRSTMHCPPPLCSSMFFSALLHSGLLCFVFLFYILLCSTLRDQLEVRSGGSRETAKGWIIKQYNSTLSCSLSFCNNQTTIALEQW